MAKELKLYKCMFDVVVYTREDFPAKQGVIDGTKNILIDTNIKRLRVQMHKQVDDLMDMAERTYKE